MKVQKILLFIMLLPMLYSCGKESKGQKKDKDEEVIWFPPPPVRPKIEPEYTPRNRRPVSPTLPEAEMPLPTEPGYVINSQRCFEGDPSTKLRLVKLIKLERVGWFRKSRYFIYDCQGTVNCEKESMLIKTEHRAYEDKMICYEHSSDQTKFSVCKDSASTLVSSYKGNLISGMSVIDGFSSTLYCDTTLFL
jgi:hypothetical protein